MIVLVYLSQVIKKLFLYIKKIKSWLYIMIIHPSYPIFKKDYWKTCV